ncbi:LEA type 2 family protein [Nonlabens ponticola]|uniref:Late embryogenesis abundant protein LEA-2 subgroup domain-containing protein n=1 Tax=Nonlabens ponticola TaxID=2496866 RepID=A0A3S9MVX8_9FLAO|nr:LEA type 2 family protein [Nonlabens ponticola]AZQ43294.1 hypothetical protein EJ995_03225 [Nonlabens ponticola]
MKNSLYIIIALLFLTACDNPYEDITFVEIKNVRLTNISKNKVDLVADCILYNPNSVGLELREADFDVFLNGKKAAKVLQEKDALMPAKEEFTFPITASIDPEELYGKKASGLFDIAIQVLANEEVAVKYEGTLKAGKGSFNFLVPVIDSLKVPVKIRN